MAFLRHLGQHNHRHLLVRLAPAFLQHGVDADTEVAEDARNRRQHAGPVEHFQTQIISGLDLLDGKKRQRSQRAGLKRQVRHAVFRVGGNRAHHIDQVRDHGRGGRLGAGAGPVIQTRAQRIGARQNRVHHAADIGEEFALGDERRMHAQLDAGRGAARQAEMLDAVPQLVGERDVLGRHLGDALHMHALELQRNAERDGGEDGQFMRGVDAVDVERRVGFRVAQLLRRGQCIAEIAAAFLHARQDVVAGAVDDAGQFLDAVGGQALAQGFDNRNAAGHRGLERDHHAALLRLLEDGVAVQRDERFVGGDHMLAVVDGAQHRLLRHAVAAD